MTHYVDQYFKNQSQWIPWNQWHNHDPGACPGVYVVGYHETNHEDATCQRVVYIGEAHDGNLGSRLYFFEHEAKGIGGPHLGGRKFCEKGWQIMDAWVRMYPTGGGELGILNGGALAQLIERELIWEFCQNNDGKLPELNAR